MSPRNSSAVMVPAAARSAGVKTTAGPEGAALAAAARAAARASLMDLLAVPRITDRPTGGGAVL